VWDGYARSYDVGAEILVCFDDYLRMAIHKNGGSIVFDTDDRHLSEIMTYTLGLGMSISMLCRGVIPLHAASVEIGGDLIGIMGRPGAGKSTLLWTLLTRGARFAGDDVLPVRMVDASAVASASMLSHLKLWGDDLERWGVDRSRCRELYPGAKKVWVPLDSYRCMYDSRTLDALFLLQPEEDPSTDAEVTLGRQFGAKAITRLLAHTHSFWAVPEELKVSLFPRYGDLARAVPLYTLSYPRQPEVLAEIAERIERTVANRHVSNTVAGVSADATVRYGA